MADFLTEARAYAMLRGLGNLPEVFAWPRVLGEVSLYAVMDGGAGEGGAVAERGVAARVPIPARRELPFRDGSEGHDGPRRVRRVLP